MRTGSVDWLESTRGVGRVGEIGTRGLGEWDEGWGEYRVGAVY
jgi:hypothetical protein